MLSKDLLIVANKIDGIVKVLDVVSSIPFRSIPDLANEIFNHAALIFFHHLLVKQTVYFKRFDDVGITVYKHGGGHVRTGTIKKIIDWG